MTVDVLTPAADETTPPAEDRKTRRVGTPSKLIFESVLIVLSVLLGFALSEWRERAAEHSLARSAVANFRREIKANLAELERVQPKHNQFAKRLAAAVTQPGKGNTAFDVFVSTMPKEGVDTPPLGEAAWEVATSTGVLRLLDYDVAAQLSETYLVQRATVLPTLHLMTERFTAAQNYDPAARAMMVRVHQMLLTELAGQESFLISIYQKTLGMLPDSARAKP